MSKLVQRLQSTRDRVYGLSDKLGVVNHVDAIFTHRIHKSKHTVTPRPRLMEPTSRVLYRFNQAQTVEVNRDDKQLVGISRAGFENYDRVKSAPDGATPELAQYPLQLLAGPLVAGYRLHLSLAADITIAAQYPDAELGLSTYVSITDTSTGSVVYYKPFTAKPLWTARNIPLKPGSYFVATCYNKVMPIVNDYVKADSYELSGILLERSCAIATANGSAVVDGSYTPLSISWGADQSYDFIYNGAICYLDGKPYTIMWVNDNQLLDYEVLVRPERRR